MRLTFLPLVACSTIATASDNAEPNAVPNAIHQQATVERAMPSYTEPAQAWRTIDDAMPVSAEQCRDAIQQVREHNGQADLRREPAEPNEPVMIAAVDHRLDGCSVMVMHDDASDIRPLPERSDSVRKYPAQ